MLRIIITIVYILICIGLAVIILMQDGKQAGLGSLTGQSTFWEKNKGRSKEGRLVKFTYLLSALFFIISLLLSMHPFH